VITAAMLVVFRGPDVQVDRMEAALKEEAVSDGS
jgi:hypothetical protein